ncbi:MAG: 3'-5' exonuclease [Mariniphaga sp.]
MNFIIFDLESTCWEPDLIDRKDHEIIEIGAVKLDDQFRMISEFQQFVRPTINSKLTEFCTVLTSITQEDVRTAQPLEVVIRLFETWIFDGGKEVKMVSWGQFDKTQIIEECTVKKIETRMESILGQHLNLKAVFAKKRKMKQCGMKAALKMLDIPLDGCHHRGIDDARNIAKIFCFLAKD